MTRDELEKICAEIAKRAGSPGQMIVPRKVSIALANMHPDAWERARRLANLGIWGGTTRAQVERMVLA